MTCSILHPRNSHLLGVWPMGRTGYGIERVRGGHALGSSVLPTDVEISRLSKPRASPGRQPAARLARMRVPPSRLWVDGRSRQPARSPPPQRPPPAAPQRSPPEARSKRSWPQLAKETNGLRRCEGCRRVGQVLRHPGFDCGAAHCWCPWGWLLLWAAHCNGGAGNCAKNRGACCRFSKGFRHRKYD